jgi:hypothetical protein
VNGQRVERGTTFGHDQQPDRLASRGEGLLDRPPAGDQLVVFGDEASCVGRRRARQAATVRPAELRTAAWLPIVLADRPIRSARSTLPGTDRPGVIAPRTRRPRARTRCPVPLTVESSLDGAILVATTLVATLIVATRPVVRLARVIATPVGTFVASRAKAARPAIIATRPPIIATRAKVAWPTVVARRPIIATRLIIATRAIVARPILPPASSLSVTARTPVAVVPFAARPIAARPPASVRHRSLGG